MAGRRGGGGGGCLRCRGVLVGEADAPTVRWVHGMRGWSGFVGFGCFGHGVGIFGGLWVWELEVMGRWLLGGGLKRGGSLLDSCGGGGNWVGDIDLLLWV